MHSMNGVRVIEFCEIAAGPYCGMLLADAGAELIKVERPQGDAMRMWPPLNEGYSENFASINRGKKSVVLDLKSEEGAAHAKALILSADVVLENFRPGVMRDFVSGLYGAFAVSTALRQVDKTGQGQHIDVAMLGATLAVAALQTSEYFGTGNDPKKLGSAHPRNAPYQAFEAADDYFGMAAGNNKLWASVCDVVNLPELATEERFASPSLRAANQVELKDILEAVFKTRSAEHWIAAFHKAGVPCSPINSYSQVLADPQVEHMGWVQDLDLPVGKKTRTFGSPLRINDQPISVDRPPPLLGEHTDEVLASLSHTQS